jgi:hypothetical protein
VVDVALDGYRGAHSLTKKAEYLEVALAFVYVARDPVADLEELGRLCSSAIDLHMAAPAGCRGLGATGADADRPQPGVDPDGGCCRRSFIPRLDPAHGLKRYP